MKRKLLYLTSIVLFSALSAINAQTKVWDFGTNTATWPVSNVGYTTDTTIESLGIYPAASGTTIGQVDPNSYTFTDNYVSTNRFKMGGSSAVTGNMPTARYLYFTVAGTGNVKIWFRSGSNSATRKITVSDGTNVLGSASSVPTGDPLSAPGVILDVPFTNVNGKIYIYNDAACYIYKIEVSGAGAAVLGNEKFNKEDVASVHSNGKLVFVSNVKSDTQVDVYGISGILVKSLKTSSDTSFDLNTGIYIVKSKSAEGEKTVKVLVN
ncbi:T9SS type A sorting domain-containing protein [Flavobacterium pectinovorum]|uniref:T9SS type A sorting domain-containing protein n=1 Tax=Flavobacterium pectinovorum TaxID=29533 RepID=UPI001FAD4982|nr:T9SS type A sorting domain-containing protein [Flavobacterium pectinovorum]MCI9844035.1 T9SS type A sorting domain-containing protein [Flavobacterium pectinovorum]